MSNIIYGNTIIETPFLPTKLTDQELANHVVTIKANAQNESVVYVADSLVNADEGIGYRLSPGEEVSIFVDADADIYIDSEEQYAGVSFIGWIKHRNRP